MRCHLIRLGLTLLLLGVSETAGAVSLDTWIANNAAFWYDAQHVDIDGDGNADVLAPGDSVAKWLDRSTNGRDAVPLSSGPGVGDAADWLNGKPTVDFTPGAVAKSGLDTLYKLPSGEKTLFLVMSGKGIAAGNSYNWGPQRFYAGLRETNERSWLGTGTTIFESDDTPVGVSFDDWHISVSSDDGSNRASQVFDGDVVTDSGFSGSTAGINTFQVGDVGWNPNPWQGNLAEVIMFNTGLSDAQKRQVAGYLQSKWGLHGILRRGTDLVANFADDGDIDGPDAGWANGWTATTDADTTATGPAIVTPVGADTGIRGGGNYLSATFSTADVHGSGTYDGTIGREMRQDDLTDDVDIGQSHRVEFDFQVEHFDNFEQNDDFINIFAADNKDAVGTTPASWLIRNIREWDDWRFYDGKGTGAYNVDLFVETGVDFEVGVDYHFAIDVHPGTRTWDAEVTGYFDTGEVTSKATGLGFRTDTFMHWDTLNFGGRMQSPGGSVAESFTVSLDSLVVSQIPEPSTLVLLLLGMTLLPLRRRRR